jgi:ABC-type nitrate/sulfonate/bicarbonate transport system permease component
VLSGLRFGLAVAVTGVLLAEKSVATAGLGWLIRRVTKYKQPTPERVFFT